MNAFNKFSTIRAMSNKVGRNEICPCGSGNKYKKCCDRKYKSGNARIGPSSLSKEFKNIIEDQKIKEKIRKQQQGLGKPILAQDFKGQKFVAVGSGVHHSPNWKTFPDFLFDYIIQKLGSEWGNAEIQKPFGERHPIMQWYDSVCRLQQKYIKQNGQVASMNMTGVIYCYYGLAYSLYLLEHNVELQDIYILRLKDINNFQGAYYELMIANCLIRAGFKLELEDETDDTSKHCEFSAISSKTNKKYWIEAKSRSVVGVLGKNESNGTKDKDPTGRLSAHLKGAFRKPALDTRLIFVDVNAPGEDSVEPSWGARAGDKMNQKEKDLKTGEAAYVFVTNMCFHWHLESEKDRRCLLVHGLGIHDFAKIGEFSFSEIYRRKQKHMDAHKIAEAFLTYGKLPTTFDGSLPSETFSEKSNRIVIGETYFFEEIGEGGTVATVTTATVDEAEKAVYVGTDKGQILSKKMSNDEFNDYLNHKDIYFGQEIHQGKNIRDPYEFFESMVEIHLKFPLENMRSRVRDFSDCQRLLSLGHEELVLAYCERICASMNSRSR